MQAFLNCVLTGLIVALGFAVATFVFTLLLGVLALIFLEAMTGGAAIAAVIGPALGAAAFAFLAVAVSSIVACIVGAANQGGGAAAGAAEPPKVNPFSRFINRDIIRFGLGAAAVAAYLIVKAH